MAKKSATWYIENNDLEGAIERLNNSYKNWKSHWFETCEKIFKGSKEWAKKYILDPINQMVVAISECITKKVPKKNGTSHTYLIKMFNECGEWVYTKIGKANELRNRFNSLIGHTYKDGNTISKIEVIKEYEVPDDDSAQVLESFMRRYFRKNESFIPNDRFKPFEPTEEDLDIFEKYYQLVLEN